MSCRFSFPPQNPYPIFETIQKLVTAATLRLAEEEWERATHRERIHSVPAAPEINLRPTPSGVEVHIPLYHPRPGTVCHSHEAVRGDRGAAASKATGTRNQQQSCERRRIAAPYSHPRWHLMVVVSLGYFPLDPCCTPA